MRAPSQYDKYFINFLLCNIHIKKNIFFTILLSNISKIYIFSFYKLQFTFYIHIQSKWNEKKMNKNSHIQMKYFNNYKIYNRKHRETLKMR